MAFVTDTLMSAGAVAQRIGRFWRAHGMLATIRFLSGRIVRHRQHLVFEAILDAHWPRPEWNGGAHLLLLGPENIDESITSGLRKFLGGEEAHENIESVRKGDRLFVIAEGQRFLHCGYILFNSRGAKLIGESENPPLIACCLTAAEARGRGLYRKALNAELHYLQQHGYKRAVIETDPANIASRRGIESAGFRLCRTVSTWTVLNFLAVRHTTGPTDKHWSLGLL
jgi:hypothetical protein